eukprot:4677965-Pleurochrysis_carterae.AAC.1
MLTFLVVAVGSLRLPDVIFCRPPTCNGRCCRRAGDRCTHSATCLRHATSDLCSRFNVSRSAHFLQHGCARV